MQLEPLHDNHQEAEGRFVGGALGAVSHMVSHRHLASSFCSDTICSSKCVASEEVNRVRFVLALFAPDLIPCWWQLVEGELQLRGEFPGRISKI